MLSSRPVGRRIAKETEKALTLENEVTGELPRKLEHRKHGGTQFICRPNPTTPKKSTGGMSSFIAGASSRFAGCSLVLLRRLLSLCQLVLEHGDVDGLDGAIQTSLLEPLLPLPLQLLLLLAARHIGEEPLMEQC